MSYFDWDNEEKKKALLKLVSNKQFILYSFKGNTQYTKAC